MADEPLRVLLIQPWIIRGAEVRDPLRAGGFAPYVYRVDHEAALAAALGRANYEVVIRDGRTGIARSAVVGLMRDHNLRVPIVEFVAGKALADAVRAALGALRS